MGKSKLKCLVVMAILFGGSAHFEATSFAQDCKIAASWIEAASSIRGLKVRRSVPCLINSKEEVKNYLLKTIDTKIPPRKIKMEEVMYKALGFIPEDFDYVHGMVDLYVSQIGGYYDPEKKHYIMAGWIPAVAQSTIAVHELTHALQDQYYNLEGIVDLKLNNSDLLLAHSALVEGDATAVMIDYGRQLVGQPGIANEPNVQSIIMQNVLGAGFTQGLRDAPSGLQLTMLFPYTSGLRFVHNLLTTDGYRGVDAAFKRIPSSTEEILHPDIYRKGVKDYEDIQVARLGGSGALLHQDTQGEFFISTLLGTFLTDKVKVSGAAKGWGGDLVGVFGNEDDPKSYEVIWLTHWDTEVDKGEFLEALKQAYSLRLGTPVGVNEWISGKSGWKVKISDGPQSVRADYQRMGT